MLIITEWLPTLTILAQEEAAVLVPALVLVLVVEEQDALEKISMAPSCTLRISIKQLKVINKTIYRRGVNVFNISIF